MNWTYGESDPGLMLFTAARERFGFDIPDGAKVLELGCAETDFLERLKRQNPSFDLTGVDQRHEARGDALTFVQGDAMVSDLFPPDSFDWIVMLGALEHFGLGFYGDPVDPAGDALAMWNVRRWLKPGGSVYFDVPFQPTYRVAENKHFRMYDDDAVTGRLIVSTGMNHVRAIGPLGYDRGVPCTWSRDLQLTEITRAYSQPEPHAGVWVERPACERVPYHYVAVLARKA